MTIWDVLAGVVVGVSTVLVVLFIVFVPGGEALIVKPAEAVKGAVKAVTYSGPALRRDHQRRMRGRR